MKKLIKKLLGHDDDIDLIPQKADHSIKGIS